MGNCFIFDEACWLLSLFALQAGGIQACLDILKYHLLQAEQVVELHVRFSQALIQQYLLVSEVQSEVRCDVEIRGGAPGRIDSGPSWTFALRAALVVRTPNRLSCRFVEPAIEFSRRFSSSNTCLYPRFSLKLGVMLR